MIDLNGIQREHRKWVDKNFPGETLEQATLGVCEEAGELAHSILKMQQKIRGSEVEHRDNAIDAVADMIIFGLSVCDHLNIDIETVIGTTWSKVKQRDWIADPQTGGERFSITADGKLGPLDQMLGPGTGAPDTKLERKN